MASRRWVLGAAVAIALHAVPALAHKVNVFAHVEGQSIRGEACFRGQTPVKGAPVIALGPAGETLGETTTDDEGKFSLDPRHRCDHRLVVDAGAGHTGDYTIMADELPGALPALPHAGYGRGVQEAGGSTTAPPASAAASSLTSSELEALRVQVVRLREQVDAFQRETRFRDVLGGIGYIAGVMGLAMYLAARRKPDARGPVA